MEIISEVSSAGSIGNSEDSSIISYLAIDGNESQSNFFVGINSDNDSSLLPKLDLTQSFYFLELEFKNFTDRILYITPSIKKDETYISFLPQNQSTDLEVAASTEVNIRIGFSLNSICSESGGEYSICLGDTTIKESLKLYFSLEEDNQSGTEVETSEDGLFLRLDVSNSIPQNAFTLTRVDTGDERLFLSVTGGEDITQMGDDFYKVNAFSFSDSTERSSANPSEGTFLLSYDGIEVIDTGEYIVNDLENAQSYNLAISKVNKFLFSSALSNSKIGTPEKVDVFIEKSSCYLLSAGFSRDHYILDYYRNFRDSILLKSSLGRKIVDYYYLFAPRFTPYIIKSQLISNIIKGVAYFGHFIFKYFAVIVGLFSVTLLAGFTYSRRRRVHGRS